MSLITSPSLIPYTMKAQGLFSSQTAFKKPNFNTTCNKLSNSSNRLTGSIHPKDLAAQQAQAAKILTKTEDQDLIMWEPVKRVKTNKVESMFCGQVSNKKIQVNTVKASKLTIDEVFNTPVESKPLNNGSFFEESFDEGSSLSFISSHPSIENLDEEIIGAKNNSNHISLVTAKKNPETDIQSLVVKDNVIQRLSYLNQEDMLLNMQSHSMVSAFDQESVFQPFELLKALPVEFPNLMCNVPLSIPANQYIHFNMHNQQLLNLSDKSVNEFVKNSLDTRVPEDGYDSDSYATRSTSIEQAESPNGEKSQKGASPLYNGSDLYEELVTENKKTEKIRRQDKRENNKEKKGRSTNLKLDLNPKQLKVERRLNRLQLLRYQQEDMQEDEEIKKFGISELLSRANSSIQENKDSQCDVNEIRLDEYENEICEHVPQHLQAVVPPLGELSKRGQRVVLKSVWDPENIQEDLLDKYFQQLAGILESEVTDQEAALKLLTTFGMHISLTLEAVRGNKELYGEMFRLKMKRLRRRGA